MRALSLIALLVAALAQTALPACADDASRSALVPIERAMTTGERRYDGQIVDADIAAGRASDGTDLVYVFRLLTRTGEIIDVRVDALRDIIVETDGRGLVAARRAP